MPKKTFASAEKAGAILITQVKENQKSLLQQIQHGCCVQPPLNVLDEVWEKQHGRLEHRKYELFSAFPMLTKWQKEWDNIVQIVRVTRFREIIGYKEKPSEEVSYYVMNRAVSLKDASCAIRRHWFIENKLHCVKDTAFLEDHATRRVNPCIFSTCIDFALNRLRSNKCDNIKGQLYTNSLHLKNSIQYFDNNAITSTP